MFTINGEEFDVYVTDSFETIKDRVASYFESMWKYLKFSPTTPTDIQDFEGDFTVENLLDSILDQDDLHFSDLRERVETDYPNLDIEKDVEEPFIAFNKLFEEDPNALRAAQGFNVSVGEVWGKRDVIKKVLLRKIRDVEEKDSANQDLNIAIDNLEPVSYTPFYFDKSTFSVEFETPAKTIEEIFNDLSTTDNVPFMVLNDIYKIKANFVPEPSWAVDNLYPTGYIVMKVNGERDTGIREIKDYYKKYTDAIFAITNGTLTATLVTDLGRRNIQRAEFQKRALETFKEKPRVITSRETNASGIFYCPHQSIDVTVWSDMVMNNPLFYNFLAVDEGIRLSKKKKNVYMKSLSNNEAIALQMNVGEKGDLPPGILDKEKYLRIRITKTPSTERAKNLQELIGKLLGVYNQEYREIADIYRSYIPSFIPVPLVTAETRRNVKELSLGEIAPDVFPPRYSRQCPKTPVIISEEEAVETANPVMKFPIFGESEPRYYICNREKEQYPGLQKNNLENNDVFPLVPCCYAKDQRSKPGSPYNSYFKKEELKKRTQTQDVFKTSKLLPVGTVGVLPKNINDLFNTVINPDYQVMRRGISQTRLSFLEAVLTAKGIVRGIEGNMIDILTEELGKFLRREFAIAAKQELYHKSEEEILEIMRVGDLRATWFINVLEIVYDCNIYIFSDEDDGTVVIPEHTMLYYKLKPRKDVILIYQHWGSEADSVRYPHCELICIAKRDNPKKQVHIFPVDNIVSTTISSVFTKMIEKRDFSKLIKPIEMKKIPILFQTIDTYGKCRMVCTMFKDEKMTVVLDPCPPFAKPSGSEIFRPAIPHIIAIITEYELPIIEQRKNPATNRTMEIVVLLGTIKGVFLTDDQGQLEGVHTNTTEMYGVLKVQRQASPLQELVVLDKTSRILTENAIYLLSRYLNGRALTKKFFMSFLDYYISLDPSVEYNVNLMRPYFEDVSNTILEDGVKLVVPNTEILKRLVYYLKLFWQTNGEVAKTYKNKTEIPNFFSSITDYKINSGEYLLAKKQAVDNLIVSKKRDEKKVVDHVVLGIDDVYFFRNAILGSKIFMAQNAPTYLHVNYIISEWRERRYNPGTNFKVPPTEAEQEVPQEVAQEPEEDEDLALFDMDINELLGLEPGEISEEKVPTKKKQEVVEIPTLPETPLINFPVYKYVNQEDITLIRHGDGRGKEQELALAYKVAGEARYTAILTY